MCKKGMSHFLKMICEEEKKVICKKKNTLKELNTCKNKDKVIHKKVSQGFKKEGNKGCK